jgi:phosphate/phosphite/phosphonate ABC transporter binding protein
VHVTTTERWNDVIGSRYRLVSRLGTGGMAEVHLAKAIGSGGFEKLVALKLLSPGSADRPANVDALQREALIGVHLDHDNVVQILDFGEDEGRTFVAMEYVRGFSLVDILRHGAAEGVSLPIRTVVHIVRAVASALDYVHRLTDGTGQPLGLIHGDVSPSNVLLSNDGRVKLSDFGIAALTSEMAGQKGVAGKPRYVPPEVIDGASLGQSADVYALSVVLYEGLSGAPAFKGFTVAELRETRAQGARGILEMRPDCPAGLAKVVMQAIAIRPEERCATAADLLRHLELEHPRQVDDAEQYRAFISELYTSTRFVESHGELPATGRLGKINRLAPHPAATGEITETPTSRPTSLRFGLSPALSSDVAREGGERLAEMLTERLGTEIRPMVFADYGTLVDCLSRGEVDFAWTPPQAFLDVFVAGGGMLAIMMRNGRITYEGAIVVRTDSSYQTIADLRGESAAWVDRRSASGYVFAFAEVAQQLAGAQPLLDREHFHGSHRAVCEAVLNGWASFGATYAMRADDGQLVMSSWTDLVPDQADELRALAFTGPIPADNIAHRPQLPSPIVQQLIKVLTELHQSPAGAALLKEVLGAEQLVYGGFELYRGLIVAMEMLQDLVGES